MSMTKNIFLLFSVEVTNKKLREKVLQDGPENQYSAFFCM